MSDIVDWDGCKYDPTGVHMFARLMQLGDRDLDDEVYWLGFIAVWAERRRRERLDAEGPR